MKFYTEVHIHCLSRAGASGMEERLASGKRVAFGNIEEGQTFIIKPGQTIFFPRGIIVVWSEP